MFAEIKRLRNLKLKKTQVSKKLGIDYKTVTKYWNMKEDEYLKLLDASKSRYKKVDIYKEEILSWIEEFPDMSAAQVYDWLHEKYEILDFKERTLRNYIHNLRETHNIKKQVSVRQYQEVEELPFGQQAQVDMGEIWLSRHDKTKIKVYCFAMVLSNSRYKFALWQERPFTTNTFILAHKLAFEFFGGMPKEIVYDQDRILSVSENNGDLILTEGFKNFLDVAKFKIYLCRAFDPENKGKVESVVKYLKYNFAKNRPFSGIENLNYECLKWLSRRGNGKVHETTKKVPKEVFALEKEHLLQVPSSIKFLDIKSSNSLIYSVRKNNTISFKQNRYELPLGTYFPSRQVEIIIRESKMDIFCLETRQLIATHTLDFGKGNLVKLSHKLLEDKERRKSIEEFYDNALKSLGYTEDAKTFLDVVKVEKARYFKEQFSLIVKSCKGYDSKVIEKSIKYCIDKNLYSATYLKDAIKYFGVKEIYVENLIDSKIKYSKSDISSKVQYISLKPDVRDIQEYKAALGGKSYE